MSLPWHAGRSLCHDCAHVKRVESAKGSVFWMCGRHATDPRHPKYPPQPVRACSGHSPAPVARGLDEPDGKGRVGRE